MPTTSRQRPEWADDLLDLAAQEATGRVVVVASSGEHGWIYLRDGSLSGVSAAIRRPLLSRRLTAFQVMSADDVRRILQAIRQEPGTRLIDVLVNQRLVPITFIESYLRNMMAEQLGAMLASGLVQVRYEPGRVQRVSPLLMSVHEVMATATAVPYTFPRDMVDQVMIASPGAHRDATPVHQAMLLASDGHRRPVDVADLCGLTAAETLQLIGELQQLHVLQLVPDTDHQQWREATGVDTLSLAPAPEPTPDEIAAEPDVLTLPAGPPIAPPATVSPGIPAAASHPATIDAPPPPMPQPFAPEPVEMEPAAEPQIQRIGAQDRRDALSVLKGLTDAAAKDAASEEPSAAPAHEPQAEVTTTSPRVWGNRQGRPANPMESGDVLRELKSLGDY